MTSCGDKAGGAWGEPAHGRNVLLRMKVGEDKVDGYRCMRGARDGRMRRGACRRRCPTVGRSMEDGERMVRCTSEAYCEGGGRGGGEEGVQPRCPA